MQWPGKFRLTLKKEVLEELNRQAAPPALADQANTKTTLNEILLTHDLVEVVPNGGDPFVVVAERGPGTVVPDGGGMTFAEATDPRLLGELGSSSPSPFTSMTRREYNPKLQGLQGLKAYDVMRRSDGTVRGTLRLVKTPVLSARWFVEPASSKTADVNAAKFVWKCLTEYMSISFPQLLTESLLMCDFGYYMFEKVWEERVIEGKDRLVWKKLAPRHPMDVHQWRYDANGGPAGVLMYPSTMGSQDYIPIPIDKLLVFTFDREAGNIEGISVLRSAYKHHFYKDQFYKIDAIQKERHGIGIPVIKLPPGFTPKDRAAANDLGRNLRTNDRAHVVLPPNWELMFAKLEGHIVDSLKSAEHHDRAIRENVLAGFLGQDTATKEEDQTMFLKATRFIADIALATFNTYAIPELVDLNFSRVGIPRLRARRIGEIEDQRTMSFAVRNLIGAEALTADDVLEDYLRDQMDLPLRDKSTSRFPNAKESVSVAAVLGPDGQPMAAPVAPGTTPAPGAAPKQSGAKAGMPRQTKKAKAAPPAKNAGTDRSGGK